MNQQKLPLLIIPSALMMGATMFLIIAVFMSVDFSNFQMRYDSEIESFLIVPFLGIFVISFISSNFVPRVVKVGKGGSDVQLKLTQTIVKYALLEGPTFFGIIMLFTTFSEVKAVSFSQPWIGLLAYLAMLLTFILDVPLLLSDLKKDEPE